MKRTTKQITVSVFDNDFSLHENWGHICPTERKRISEGGQSTIYVCENSIIKVYKKSWTIDMANMKRKMKALNSLNFVPKTFEFYSNGLRQEQLFGTFGGGMTEKQLQELGHNLALIHQLPWRDFRLKQPTVCDSNSPYIKEHLSMNSVKWLLKCSFSEETHLLLV